VNHPIRIPLPLGMSYPTVNAWLFTELEPVLVDCGLNTPGTRAALGEALALRGLGFGDLTKLIVTHTHVDHAGLAGEIAAHEGRSGFQGSPHPGWLISSPGWRAPLFITLHRRRRGIPGIHSYLGRLEKNEVELGCSLKFAEAGKMRSGGVLINMVRIVIVEDHPVMQTGLAELLGKVPDFKVVGLAGCGAEALALVESRMPDIVILDYALPDISGADVALTIRKSLLQPRILAYSGFDNQEYIRGMMAAGASGYLLKTDTVTSLVAGIRAVMRGKPGLVRLYTKS